MSVKAMPIASQVLLVLLLLCLGCCSITSAFKMGSPEDMSYWQSEVRRVQNYTAELYMAKISTMDNVSTLPSGLRLTVVKRGHGDVAPAEDDLCEVHYTLYYHYESIIEDTRRRARPVKRRPSDLVPGMKEAMELMREGDRFFLHLPYYLAYGTDSSKDGKVKPYTNLRCDLEVVKCESPKGKTSEEIEDFLKPHLKLPMPPKTAPVNDDDL
ncbi:peptidylprolyl isomerase [Strigomonas culicis]|uniref:peptidylprolyl isomerase n=1 Tax=Strigomonas culicis TaxID=28005 RepID=S9UXF5_9TRYP|nr:peptidylprolyl isomerase [Strigomonas culicis]EPY33444.1 peptidylprolyl isomerase [Strigomonas culicis]|eukprot:EPY30271.1 peptidylprolyl isomerase [Strigomonas culicis]